MGIDVVGYKCNEIDACCGRGTFNVFLRTVEKAVNRLLNDKNEGHWLREMLERQKENNRVDVLDKLLHYTETSVRWYSHEISALSELLDNIDYTYCQILREEYKDDEEEYTFHLRYFLKFELTVDESDLLIISL